MKTKILMLAILLPMFSFSQKHLVHFGAKVGTGVSSFVNYTIEQPKITINYAPDITYGARIYIGKRIGFFAEILNSKERFGFREVLDSGSTLVKNFEMRKYELPIGIRIRKGVTIVEAGLSYSMLTKFKQGTYIDNNKIEFTNDIDKMVSYYNGYISLGERFCKSPDMSLNFRMNCSLTPVTKDGYPFKLVNEKIFIGSFFMTLDIML